MTHLRFPQSITSLTSHPSERRKKCAASIRYFVDYKLIHSCVFRTGINSFLMSSHKSSVLRVSFAFCWRLNCSSVNIISDDFRNIRSPQSDDVCLMADFEFPFSGHGYISVRCANPQSTYRLVCPPDVVCIPPAERGNSRHLII